ncbi:MAG: hypothetical protein E7293_02400 [Lachnospiraceae bacterium]|nr:hypothetical protein [Lachnospiraceae bacterium]
MKKLFAIVLAMVMCLSLVACGGPDKQTAIDAFNSANTVYTKIAVVVNSDADFISDEDLATLLEIADGVVSYKALLESDTKLTEDQINEIVAWGADVEETVGAMLETYEIE